MIIRLKHMRAVPCMTGYGYCSKGIRIWFDRYKLDWDLFIKEGLDESHVEHINDAMAKKVIETAHKMDKEEKLNNGL